MFHVRVQPIISKGPGVGCGGERLSAARVVTPGVFGLRTIIVGEGDIVEREQGMMVVL